MEYYNKILSDITAFNKYAKYLPSFSRRESLEETINRSMHMHLDMFPKLSKDIIEAYRYVHSLEIMPSMRSMQFSGDAILKNNSRIYNCAAAPVDDIRSFGELFFLLLAGTGTGFSVQKRHTQRLPTIKLPREEGVFKVQDSIIGWSQALDMLMEAYMLARVKPVYDFSSIRAKGSLLVTTGARAPGPEPLKSMLALIEEKLKIAIGRKLRSIEVYDIICLIADCTMKGGIRRAATICLFDKDDQDMLNCKSGAWWEKHPYRARSNNSVILLRSDIEKEEFNSIFNSSQISGAGEPGISFSNNLDWLVNPCHEVSLRPNQFCNLTIINQTNIRSKKDFLKRIHAATILATLQASYTDFPYLRDVWKETTEEDCLIGVSFTGIADSQNIITNDLLREGAALVLDVNSKYAKKIGINEAARCTVIKPEGTSSALLSSSSGIHSRHAHYYLRRIRLNKGEALDSYIRSIMPYLIEDEIGNSYGSVFTIPQKSPEGSIIRSQETAIQLLKRVMDYNQNWVAPGHRSGENNNNVSVTVSIKDHEWDEVREFMWENRYLYTGISLLPYDGGTYKQLPFEECSEDLFNTYNAMLKQIDLRDVKEQEDNTNFLQEIACGGGLCEKP